MILFLDFTDFDNVHFVFAGTRTKTTAQSALVLSCAFFLALSPTFSVCSQ